MTTPSTSRARRKSPRSCNSCSMFSNGRLILHYRFADAFQFMQILEQLVTSWVTISLGPSDARVGGPRRAEAVCCVLLMLTLIVPDGTDNDGDPGSGNERRR